MKWHKKAILKELKEAVSSGAFYIAFVVGLLLWHFGFGKSFEWVEIEPISTPFWYTFYSALVFVGPGAYLFYFTDFYKDLKSFFVRTLGAPNLHKGIKGVVWLSMAVVIFLVVKTVVEWLNTILSFFYNVLGLILYFCPPLGFALIVYAVVVYAKRRKLKS